MVENSDMVFEGRFVIAEEAHPNPSSIHRLSRKSN
jgi:hypothetical protein